ncbi:sugar phosphate isomerase/epimerase family protein [Gemmatimonas sp.]|uniref:sugar phosphate isomerase/epimerase family protein n=1 Tax=Gemmatimonas sp. TaxID=1962908 RepID=UPI00356579DF
MTNPMPRRSFLAALGTGALGAGAMLSSRAAGASGAAANAGRLDRIGLELYAVRKAMKENPEKTLAAIRAIGYTDVELLWSFKNFDRSPSQVKATLKAEGLTATSAHIAPETLLSEWSESLRTAKLLGHQYLVVPSLPSETKRSINAWKIWADRFNVAGEEARRAGIWLALHNEPDHQRKVEGEFPLELFLKRTEPKFVRFQLDVGNMLMGGGDPLDFLSRYKDRIGSFHLKNVVADHIKDTELSAGTFDLRAFLAAVPDLAKKPCFVEQEGAADELASAKANFEYLRGLNL